jgi:CMP-N,N'-diacetyllegionaminic acid synthase
MGDPTMKTDLLALIPARSNSSRLAAKNLQPLGGKPLIVHTIECALQCKSIDRVIVSTDSPELQNISRRAGAEVPFLRPAGLASAAVATTAVVLHAIQFLKEHEDRIYDYFIVLQPTSPLRTPDDIEQAFQLLLTDTADSVVSVSAAPIPLAHLMIEENGYLKPVTARPVFPQKQLSFYKFNGAIYLSRTDILLNTGRLLG